MKFGVMLPYGLPGGSGWADPRFARAAVQRAEQLGFESVWAGEHVAFRADYAPNYPYSPDGKTPLPLQTCYTDPLVQLGWAAAFTETIKLGTGVVVLPQRQPLHLAKEAATIDLLSGGRLIMAVGLGWQREEYEALGMPFEGRARRMDESIAALRALWAEDAATSKGEHIRFEQMLSYPKPLRNDIPLLIGGHSMAAARRAGALGDGLFALVSQPSEVAPLRAAMRDAAAAAGRDPSTMEITVGRAPDEAGVKPADVLDTVKEYEAAGVDRIVLFRVFEQDTAEMNRFLDSFAEDIIQPCAADVR